MHFQSSHDTSVSTPIHNSKNEIKNIVTYLLTYLRNNESNKVYSNTAKHTTLIKYDDNEWKKFKTFCMNENTNPNRFIWAMITAVNRKFDPTENTLDSFFDTNDIVPKIDDEPKQVLSFLKTKNQIELRVYEEKLMRDYTLVRALTQGATKEELENFPELWRKYHP